MDVGNHDWIPSLNLHNDDMTIDSGYKMAKEIPAKTVYVKEGCNEGEVIIS